MHEECSLSAERSSISGRRRFWRNLLLILVVATALSAYCTYLAFFVALGEFRTNLDGPVQAYLYLQAGNIYSLKGPVSKGSDKPGWKLGKGYFYRQELVTGGGQPVGSNAFEVSVYVEESDIYPIDLFEGGRPLVIRKISGLWLKSLPLIVLNLGLVLVAFLASTGVKLMKRLFLATFRVLNDSVKEIGDSIVVIPFWRNYVILAAFGDRPWWHLYGEKRTGRLWIGLQPIIIWLAALVILGPYFVKFWPRTDPWEGTLGFVVPQGRENKMKVKLPPGNYVLYSLDRSCRIKPEVPLTSEAKDVRYVPEEGEEGPISFCGKKVYRCGRVSVGSRVHHRSVEVDFVLNNCPLVLIWEADRALLESIFANLFGFDLLLSTILSIFVAERFRIFDSRICRGVPRFEAR